MLLFFSFPFSPWFLFFLHIFILSTALHPTNGNKSYSLFVPLSRMKNINTKARERMRIIIKQIKMYECVSHSHSRLVKLLYSNDTRNILWHIVSNAVAVAAAAAASSPAVTFVR